MNYLYFPLAKAKLLFFKICVLCYSYIGAASLSCKYRHYTLYQIVRVKRLPTNRFYRLEG